MTEAEMEARRQEQLAAILPHMSGGKKAPDTVSVATLGNLVTAIGRKLGALAARLDRIEAALDLPPPPQPETDHLDAKAASAIEGK